MDWFSAQRDFLVRAGLVVGISTIALTTSFVGLLGLLSGEVVGSGKRLPFYLIVAGIAFVGTIILLEEYGADGEVIIVTAIITGTLTLLTTGLSVEGMLYAYRNPALVFVSQLVFYFIAAALIGTGIAYWGVNHWREFTGDQSDGL